MIDNLKQEYDAALLEIMRVSGLAHTVSQLAYVCWKRTGKRNQDELIRAGLERLYIQGWLARRINYRQEPIYRYQPAARLIQEVA